MSIGSKLDHNIPDGFTCFIYTLKGTGKVCGQKVGDSTCVSFEQNGNSIEIEALDEFEFVVLAGKPIGEPVVQHGPFVMNSNLEIQKTFNDYSNYENGFENARYWQSSIGQYNRFGFEHKNNF